MSMWAMYNLLELSYPDLGQLFGRHHTSILSACQKVSERMRTDNEFADHLNEYIRAIDPKHRILEHTYDLVFEDDRYDELLLVAQEMVTNARRKGIKTIVAKFTLLRGTPPPAAPGQRKADEDDPSVSNDLTNTEPR
jgi:hypothetical protein